MKRLFVLFTLVTASGCVLPANESPTIEKEPAIVAESVHDPNREENRMSPLIELFEPQTPISLFLSPPTASEQITLYDVLARATGPRGTFFDVGAIELSLTPTHDELMDVKYDFKQKYGTFNDVLFTQTKLSDVMNHTKEAEIDRSGRVTTPDKYKEFSLDYLRTESYLSQPPPTTVREYHFRLPCFPKDKNEAIKKGDKWKSYDAFSGVDIFRNIVFEVEGFARVDGVETIILKESIPSEISDRIGLDLEGKIYVSIEDKLPLFGSETVTYHYTEGTIFTVTMTFRRK